MRTRALRNTRHRRTLHCTIHYPTECLPVWKQFYFKLLEPFEETVLCCCEAKQSLKERPLSLKEGKIRS